MKFIVEDGTGIPLANSFVDVDFIDTYAQEMGKDDKWGVAFDSEGLPLTFDAIQKKKQQAAIQGSRWLSSTYTWRGQQLTAHQGLAFPRINIQDTAQPPLPYIIREAAASLAIRIFSGVDLNKDAIRGGLIKSVKAGPVAVEYAANAPSGTLYTEIENMIKALAVGLGGTEFITTTVRI